MLALAEMRIWMIRHAPNDTATCNAAQLPTISIKGLGEVLPCQTMAVNSGARGGLLITCSTSKIWGIKFHTWSEHIAHVHVATHHGPHECTSPLKSEAQDGNTYDEPCCILV